MAGEPPGMTTVMEVTDGGGAGKYSHMAAGWDALRLEEKVVVSAVLLGSRTVMYCCPAGSTR